MELQIFAFRVDHTNKFPFLFLPNLVLGLMPKNSKAKIKFGIDLVKDALEYLMGNCYFTFGSKVFRQVIGIPMGSDPAPFMANLFLYTRVYGRHQALRKFHSNAKKFSDCFINNSKK